VPIIKNQAVNLKTNSVKVAQRAFQILVVLLLIFPLRIFSQQQLPPGGKNTSHTPRISNELRRKFLNDLIGFQSESKAIARRNFLEGGNRDLLESYPIFINSLPTSSAFFCKKELQFENATSIPLRLRLGSLEYVNRLEGKEKWINPDFH
jgi:hypothetical protein